MKCHATLDRVVGQPLSAPRDALENGLRQILALEEQAEVGLVQMRIFEQGPKDLFARVAEQRRDRAARGGPRVLRIELSLPCHAQECCVSHWPGGTLRDVWPVTHAPLLRIDRKSTRLNSSHVAISDAGLCL